MLKKINVKQLTLGMHLKEFCGSWMDHPFWRNAFVITDPADIERILSSNISEVWIDCSKGFDVAAGEPVAAEAETDAQVDAELQKTAETEREITPVPTSAEYARAARICTQARRAVSSMFKQARLGKAIETGNVKQLVREISDSIARNPVALINLARLKTSDDYTYMHSVAVCALMIALSRQLGLSAEETHSAGIAGLLHDIGKAVMPPEILNKPGKLTDEEFSVMKKHPAEGHRLLLGNANANEMALDVVLHHHEKIDGSGYPERLPGSEISLYAKMGAVCDVYDAITSNRAYKKEWDPAESLARMTEWTKGHFDPAIFQAFVKCVGIYPVGSLIRLKSGRLGIVIDQSRKSLLKPIIKVFYSTQSQARIKPIVIDLSNPGCAEKIDTREDPDNWDFPDLNELWLGTPA